MADILPGTSAADRYFLEPKNGCKLSFVELILPRELRLNGLHDLKGDRIGQKAFSLDKSVRLVFAPGTNETPRKDDGGVDWRRVTIVSIEYIGNYHD